MNNTDLIFVGNNLYIETMYKNIAAFGNNPNNNNLQKTISMDTMVYNRIEAHKMIDEYFDEVEKLEKI